MKITPLEKLCTLLTTSLFGVYVHWSHIKVLCGLKRGRVVSKSKFEETSVIYEDFYTLLTAVEQKHALSLISIQRGVHLPVFDLNLF